MLEINGKDIGQLIETAPTKQINIHDLVSFIGVEKAGLIEDISEIIFTSIGDKECSHCGSLKPIKLVPKCSIYSDFAICQIQGLKPLCKRCFDINSLASAAHEKGGDFSSVPAWHELLTIGKEKHGYKTDAIVQEVTGLVEKYHANFEQSLTWDVTYLNRRGLSPHTTIHFDYHAFVEQLKSKNATKKAKLEQGRAVREAGAFQNEQKANGSSSVSGYMDPSENEYNKRVGTSRSRNGAPAGAIGNIFDEEPERKIKPDDIDVKNISDLDDYYDDSDNEIV